MRAVALRIGVCDCWDVLCRAMALSCVILLLAGCRSRSTTPHGADAAPSEPVDATVQGTLSHDAGAEAASAAPACATIARQLALPRRVQTRMRKVMTSARTEGHQSLAGPALVGAARRCAERMHEASRQLATDLSGPEERQLKPALSSWLSQAEVMCRTAGDDASRAMAEKSDQGWAEMLKRLKSDLDALADSWRAPSDRVRQDCGEHAGESTVNPPPERPVEIRTRVREVDGATLVWIPAGGFVMGADDDDAELDEGPARWQELGGFWIDRTEVTVQRYGACIKAGACTPQGTGPSCERGAQGDRPVNCVTWDQAVSYCRWAGARLPTEAEWEKAARGPSARKYPWGQEEPSCDRAVFFDPVRGHGCGTHATFPVGSRPSGASPYGALDMAGSVWEWVADLYSADPLLPATQSANPLRVLRGGGWGKDGKGSLRTTMRLRFAPSNSTPGTGLRCAMSP